MKRGSVHGRPWLLAAAIVLAIAGSLAPFAAQEAAAAGEALSVTSSATYTLQPAKHVVRVLLDLTATNNKPDTTAGGIVTRYFYQGARVVIQAEARNVVATTGGSRLTTSVSPADGYAVLEVRFRTGLFYHQTAKVRVTFDLPGGAPRSASDIRVGAAFATFVAWAFGDSGSVRIVVPSGFEAETTGSSLERRTSGGATVFTAGGIQDVGTWYAVVNADRKAGLTGGRIDLPGGEHIVIRAWPEDTAWRTRVTALLTDGLPELVSLIGLDWPVAGDLQVFEVHTPLLEGYAGVFFENQDKIEISEDLDDLTILHESSHAWFNRALFDGRWMNEGFADAYAARALDAIRSGGLVPDRVSPNDAAAVPLADWTTPGRISDAATEAREHYGYEASWTVIRSLVGEIGVDRMRAVLGSAKDRRIAYVGAVAAETVAGAVDWRRFLDLLDEAGGSKTADDLFRRWVLDAADRERLDARSHARIAYQAIGAAGRDWLPPAYVRLPMSGWDFAAAEQRIAAATAVLASRDRIAAVVAPIGIDPPADLRTAYETATSGLEQARALAGTELDAARALAAADGAAKAPRGLFVSVGLIGQTPEADLAAARAAFQTGATDAASRAQALSAMIGGATAVGQGRIAVAIGVLIVVALILLVLAAILVRRRRATARRAAHGRVVAPSMAHRVANEAGSYATLPDQSAEPGWLRAGAPDDQLPVPPEQPDSPVDPSAPPADPPEERDIAP